MSEQPKPKLTPESKRALAGHTVEPKAVPKKIPAVDDIEGQKNSLVGALSNALLMATDEPVTLPPDKVGAIAEQLVAYGVRQTEHVDQGAMYAPTWITDGVRQQSVKLPEQPKHTESEPVVPRTAVSPVRPLQIPQHARAVKR